VCPDDDDSLLGASGSGAIRKAWENQFVAGLMESTHSAFQKVKTCSINMNPSTPEAENAPNVDIDVTCKNKDFSKLSVSKGTYLAHAVQAAYNKVHAGDPNDDSNLDQVFYHGQQTMELAATETLGKTSTSHYGGWKAPGLTGYWGCRLCPKYDDMLLGATDSGSALKAWEAELVVALVEGPIAYFHDVTQCFIKLIPRPLTLEANEVEDDSIPCGIRGGCATEE
jgi:hypothetical protein